MVIRQLCVLKGIYYSIEILETEKSYCKQGGDPQSIDFCYRIGLDYVSCSPYRVPIARLAAAHATIKKKNE